MNFMIINRPRVFPYRRLYQIAKRCMDVCLCVLGMPLFLLVMAVCAVAIRLDSPGPVLFVQDRVGKGGRPFRMVKFRTMRQQVDRRAHQAFMQAFVNGEIGGETDTAVKGRYSAFMRAFVRRRNGSGPQADKVYKPIQSSQVTRVGRILRKTSLDELPQVFNVLKGEMSLVGPRPNVPAEVTAYRPWHHERLEVLPGITGLAQVRGRSAISFDRIVHLDIEYVETCDLLLDVKILWWTVAAVFQGTAAE